MYDTPGKRPKLPPLQTAGKATMESRQAESSRSTPVTVVSGTRSSGLFANPWRSSSSRTAHEFSARPLSDSIGGETRRVQKLTKHLSRASRDSAASSIKSDEIPSAPWNDTAVIRYGPLRTTSSTTMLKSRKVEYLVLTPRVLMKFEDVDAAQAAMNDQQTHVSVSSKPNVSGSHKRVEIPLEKIVSVFKEEGSTPNFGIEVWSQVSVPRISRTLTRLFFCHPKERDEWLVEITKAARNYARDQNLGPSCFIPDNIDSCIRNWVMDHEPEDQILDLGIYPVVKRFAAPRRSAKGNAEDYSPSSYFLAVGLYMAFLFEFPKTTESVGPMGLEFSARQFGVVALVRFKATMSPREERFVLRIRIPFGEETRFELASRFYRDIISRFMRADRFLKPAWPQHLQSQVFDIKGLSGSIQLAHGDDMGGIKRTLAAYCAAYSVELPPWEPNWRAKFAPEFKMKPLDPSKRTMWSGQLMAVFRALRFNDYFKSLCFRDVDMGCLWGMKDVEYEDSVVEVSRTGIAVDFEHVSALKSWPFLSREIHAVVFSSGSIRAIDLTNVLRNKAIGAASVEVLVPLLYLLRGRVGLCESINVGGNPLSKDDVEELTDALCSMDVKVRDLDISRCQLQAGALEDIWYALGYQGCSLITLNVSQNMGHVDQATVSRALGQFTSLRRLGMSNVGVHGGNGGLTFESIWKWPLEELNLSGVALDYSSVSALCQYLKSEASMGLKVLSLEKTGISGYELSQLFRSMGQGREMIVYANGGSDEKDGPFQGLAGAISNNYGPTALYLDRWDFAHEDNYVRLMKALAHSSTLRLFSATGTLIPREMSPEGGRAIEEFLAKNKSVRYLDLSGYDCKLETSRFGRNFAAAMGGLRHNDTLLHLRIKDQMLGRNVSGLASAIAENKKLRTLDIPGSGFRLSEFTFLTKALQRNNTLRRVALFSGDADREQAILTSCGLPPVSQASLRKRALWPPALTKSTTQEDISAVRNYDERRTQLEREWNANRARILEYIDRNKQHIERERERDMDGGSSYAEAWDDAIDESHLSEVFGGLAAEQRSETLRRASMQSEAKKSQELQLSEIRPLDIKRPSVQDKGKGKGKERAVDQSQQHPQLPDSEDCQRLPPNASMIPLVEEMEVPPIPPMNPNRLRPAQRELAPLRCVQRSQRDSVPSPGGTGSSVVPTPPELETLYGDTGDESSPDNPRTPAEGFPEGERNKAMDLLKHKFWRGSMDADESDSRVL